MQYDPWEWLQTDLVAPSDMWAGQVPVLAHWHGGPALVSNRLVGCVLSIEQGHGMPDDWTYDVEQIFTAKHTMKKRSWHGIDAPAAFIIYNGKFLLNFPVADQAPCVQSAEQVLATYWP